MSVSLEHHFLLFSDVLIGSSLPLNGKRKQSVGIVPMFTRPCRLRSTIDEEGGAAEAETKPTALNGLGVYRCNRGRTSVRACQ